MKALGFAIIAGSFTLKVPQIKNILAAGTVSGLSFVGMYDSPPLPATPTWSCSHHSSHSARYIETLGFLSTTVFHLLSQSPIRCASPHQPPTCCVSLYLTQQAGFFMGSVPAVHMARTL